MTIYWCAIKFGKKEWKHLFHFPHLVCSTLDNFVFTRIIASVAQITCRYIQRPMNHNYSCHGVTLQTCCQKRMTERCTHATLYRLWLCQQSTVCLACNEYLVRVCVWPHYVVHCLFDFLTCVFLLLLCLCVFLIFCSENGEIKMCVPKFFNIRSVSWYPAVTAINGCSISDNLVTVTHTIPLSIACGQKTQQRRRELAMTTRKTAWILISN